MDDYAYTRLSNIGGYCQQCVRNQKVTFVQRFYNPSVIFMNKKCFSWYHSLAAIWAASWQNKQNGMCAQRRLRSAWASAQSDQSLRCALNGYVSVLAFFKRTAKTLIRLGGCPGWSESSLGANSFSWFWHVVAQFCDCGTPLALRFVIVEFPGLYIVYFLPNIHDLCTANEQLPNASV